MRSVSLNAGSSTTRVQLQIHRAGLLGVQIQAFDRVQVAGGRGERPCRRRRGRSPPAPSTCPWASLARGVGVGQGGAVDHHRLAGLDVLDVFWRKNGSGLEPVHHPHEFPSCRPRVSTTWAPPRERALCAVSDRSSAGTPVERRWPASATAAASARFRIGTPRRALRVTACAGISA